MHDIEPHFKWRHNYIASEDSKSPFYGRVYDEFKFTNKVYNYFIHPQWDFFGSATLYMKILFVEYDEGYAIIELIGEWNDCLKNDIMYLKREIVDELARYDISKYILICENVLNFHGSDDCYYEEWYNDIVEEDGWICLLNTLKHVQEEMNETQLHPYINFGIDYELPEWRSHSPKLLFHSIQNRLENKTKSLY